MEVEKLRLLHLTLRDQIRLVLILLRYGTLARLPRRRRTQRPRIIKRALRKIRLHRLIRSQMRRQHKPVSLVVVLERRPRTITRIRRARQRNSLTIRTPSLRQPNHALQRHIKQIRVRPLSAHRVEDAISKLVNLLLRVRQHRNIRIAHRPPHRIPIRIPTIKPDRPLRMQLSKRQPATKLRLSRTLTPRNPTTPKPATTLKRMALRINLVQLPNRRTLLPIKNSRLTLQRTRPEHGPILNQITNRAAQRRELKIITRNNDNAHTIFKTARGSPPSSLGFGATDLRRFCPRS